MSSAVWNRLIAVTGIGLLAACSSNPVAQPADTTGAMPTVMQGYIVQMRDAPLASYMGGITALAATSPQATGASAVDLNSHASRAYVEYLKAQQAKLVESMTNVLGRKIVPTFAYYYAMNGLAVILTIDEAAKIARLPGVVSVRQDTVRHTTTPPPAASF